MSTAIAPSAVLIAHCGTNKITRGDLAQIDAPEGTATHKPVAHIELVNTLIESLAYRHLEVIRDEYAVSQDGMKMFGVMDLSGEEEGFRFSIGLRNSNDKTMRIALTAGLRVFVCDNMAFKGDFQPLLAKHSKNLTLQEVVVLGVDKIQRGFDPLRQQVGKWRSSIISDGEAKVRIYDAFLKMGVMSRQFLPEVHRAYFEPEYDEFKTRTAWSLFNAFTHVVKQLPPVRQFQVTAKIGALFQSWN